MNHSSENKATLPEAETNCIADKVMKMAKPFPQVTHSGQVIYYYNNF